MLHGLLISGLLLLPVQGLRGDDAYQIGTECYVSVEMRVANDGAFTGTVEANSSVTVEAVFTEYSWETWYDPNTGDSYSTNHDSNPVGGTSVSFAIISTNGGVLSSSNAITDEGGRAQVDFTAGASAGSAEVSAYISTANGTNCSGSLNFSVSESATLIWSKLHDEGTLVAEITTVSGSEIPAGQAVNLDLSVVYSAWEVWTSDYGDFEVRNDSSSTANGAQIVWTVKSGDGSISQTATATDAGGNSGVVFTMGDSPAEVEAGVTYGGSFSAVASINFSPPPADPGTGDPATGENWSYWGQESIVQSVTLSTDGPADGLVPGQVSSLFASVETMVWDVWTSDQGGLSYLESGLSPTEGLEVTFSLDLGDGTLSSATAMTDANGIAGVAYTMAGEATTVRASTQSAWYGEVSGTLDLSPEISEQWTPDGTDSVKSLGIGIDGPQQYFRAGETVPIVVSVSETIRQWEINNSGVRRIASETTQSCSGESVTVNSDAGSFSGGTDGDGRLYGSISLGSGGVTLTASLGDGTSSSLGLAATDEVWSDGPLEGVIEASLVSSGSLSGVVVGAVSTLTAKVDYHSWQLQTSNFGETRRVNENIAPAIGAPVSFWTAGGDGQVTEVTSVADASGYATATFEMGQLTSTVQVQANYYGASTTAALTISAEE